MSVSTQQPPAYEADDYAGDYRALSAAAVASFVLGVLSLSAILHWAFALVPICGIALAAIALMRIRHDDSLTGAAWAKVGFALSVLGWAGGWSWLTYDYLTEVPPGYSRISYAELQSNGNEPVPESARRLDGQRVFIKGYIYPGPQTYGIRRFVLVRDNGTCCFGGPTPKLNDMVDVTLADSLRVNYATRVFRVAGTFRVEESSSPGLGQVLYRLEADYVK